MPAAVSAGCNWRVSRPLRDERTAQRYLAAVQSGQAHGWHTMVYGVTLAVYSLPLRQGLLHYAQETLSALASAAGRAGNVAEAELAEILTPLLARIPQAVEARAPAGRGLDQPSFHGGRKGRVSNSDASGSSKMSSFSASHLSFRPTSIEISPRWPGIAE
jgi:hypothetical protein